MAIDRACDHLLDVEQQVFITLTVTALTRWLTNVAMILQGLVLNDNALCDDGMVALAEALKTNTSLELLHVSCAVPSQALLHYQAHQRQQRLTAHVILFCVLKRPST